MRFIPEPVTSGKASVIADAVLGTYVPTDTPTHVGVLVLPAVPDARIGKADVFVLAVTTYLA